jgi:hypothetical protein
VARPLTDHERTILGSATFFPPSAWVVSPVGGRTGLERVAWKRGCERLVEGGLLRPNAHGDYYLTDEGEDLAMVEGRRRD